MWSNDSLPPAPAEQEKMERSGRKNLSGTRLQDVYGRHFFGMKNSKKSATTFTTQRGVHDARFTGRGNFTFQQYVLVLRY
jgi:hypothetical protein